MPDSYGLLDVGDQMTILAHLDSINFAALVYVGRMTTPAEVMHIWEPKAEQSDLSLSLVTGEPPSLCSNSIRAKSLLTTAGGDRIEMAFDSVGASGPACFGIVDDWDFEGVFEPSAPAWVDLTYYW